MFFNFIGHRPSVDNIIERMFAFIDSPRERPWVAMGALAIFFILGAAWVNEAQILPGVSVSETGLSAPIVDIMWDEDGDKALALVGEGNNGHPTVEMRIQVPVTSLCPCSKEISDYGAHNQRSHVTAKVKSTQFIWIEEVIDIIEAEASCELYGLLKRPDEKFVTEKAYDNPKFVEDLVRDIAKRFNDDERIDAYSVEAENFESIHNHSAYAQITRGLDS